MVNISTSIVIGASPAKVKEVFFDFKSYPEWNSFVTSIKGDSVEVGSKLDVQIKPPGKGIQRFQLTVTDNTEEKFGWVGVVGSSYIFHGHHTYEFIPIENGTKTKLVQEEEFTGIMSSPLLYFIKGVTTKGFNQLNEDLKARVEKLA